MNLPKETAFTPDWPEPAPWTLRADLPPAPALQTREVLHPALADWVEAAADAKGAPADYVLAGLLAVAGGMIGNARWVSPWNGWQEPPLIWAMVIGLPSAGKSPGLDAVLTPLRAVERPLRKAAEAERAEWTQAADLAQTREQAWRETVKKAEKGGKTTPPRPDGLDPGPEPHLPRLAVSDATIEKLGAILDRQPKGALQVRDELSGWLENMARYNAGSDRGFWLEAYGGRTFTVDRIGRASLTIERLAIGVVGGIQPDRLASLLLKGDDDGLVARILPFWPDPAPVRRPTRTLDEGLMEALLARLHGLAMVTDEAGHLRPWFVPFDEPARELMDDWRVTCREHEADASGLLLSFIGKLPGMAARLALVLALLDWATAPPLLELQAITADHMGRACHFLEAYALPMARRAYAAGSQPKAERAALRLLAMIREHGWATFTSRDVLRAERTGLARKADLDPALAALEEADAIRAIPPASSATGRPSRGFLVNPAILRVGL
jgi:hypothetical protein